MGAEPQGGHVIPIGGGGVDPKPFFSGIFEIPVNFDPFDAPQVGASECKYQLLREKLVV